MIIKKGFYRKISDWIAAIRSLDFPRGKSLKPPKFFSLRGEFWKAFL